MNGINTFPAPQFLTFIVDSAAFGGGERGLGEVRGVAVEAGFGGEFLRGERSEPC